MNKILLALISILALNFTSEAVTFTSIVNGGNWRSAATWSQSGAPVDADGIPDGNDDVIIATGFTVNWGVLASTAVCRHLTVQTGAVINGPNNASFQLTVRGNYTNDGTETGRGLYLFASTVGTTISGSGTFVSNNVWSFTGTNRTIASDVTVTKTDWTRLYNGSTIINEGNMNLFSLTAFVASSSFENRGTLTMRSNNFMNIGTFIASAVNNTVIIDWKSGSSGDGMKNPVGGYYNLELKSPAIDCKATGNLDVNNNLTIRSGVDFDLNNFNLNLGGNYDDLGSGNLLNFTGTITFDGTGTQNIDVAPAAGIDGTQWDCNVVISGTSSTVFNDDMRFNDLTIAGSLDLSASDSEIQLLGDWVNNGIFISQSGRISMDGSIAQTMSGTSTTTFFDVETNNPTSVTLTSGTFELDGRLITNAGTFDLGSNLLTVTSDATRTGSINTICATCSVNGTFTMRRFIGPGNADYRDICNPFGSALTFADWDDDMLISCSSCPDGCAFGGGCFGSISSYDATSDSYVPLTAISDNIVNNVGYEAFFGDDLSSFSGTTLDMVGSANGPANIVITLQTNAGAPTYNLVANPFCSEIDFDGLIVGSNVSDFYYVYDPSTGGYEYYDASGVTVPANSGSIPANGHVASCQAFWVQASGGTPFSRQLHFLQGAKRGTGDVFIKSAEGANNPQFFVNVENKGNNTSCKSKLVYINDAQTDLDSMDIPLFRGPQRPTDRLNPLIWFEAGNEDIRMSAVPFTKELSQTFPLMFNSELSGRFVITAEDLDMFNEFQCVLLYDKEEDIYINLRRNDYTFDYTGTYDDVQRFDLIVSNEAMCDVFMAQDNMTKDGNKEGMTIAEITSLGNNEVQVSIDNNSSNESATKTITVYDMLGKVISTNKFSGNYYRFTPNASTGTYIIHLQIGNEIFKNKIIVQ